MRTQQHGPGASMVFLARIACALLLACFPWSAGAGKPGGNQPPTVTLTSPSNGASFTAPATVGLAATATDPDGTVARVDFFAGTTLIGTATSAPYTATWSNVAAGSYSLTAKATDNAGAVTTSAPVSISVSSATALVITGPANGAAVNVFSTLTVTGTFEGPADSTILVDNEQSSILATISSNTFSASFVFGIGAVGTNTITVKLSRPDGISAIRSVSVTGYDTPRVAFTAPSCDTFSAPANITLAVDAKAPGGTITRVQFFRGSTLLGTVTTPPYQFNWTNVAAGTYTITANATSSSGLVGSAQTTIIVLGPNTPPSVSITSPTAGATFTAPANIPITVNATDPDGTVKTVEYFANASLIGTTNVAPFGMTWSNVAAGSHALTARATDDRGGQTTSAPVNITVIPPNQPPTVTLTAPAQGATFIAPATIALTATASDPDGSIAKVDFYQGTTLIGTATTSPYTFNWTNVAAGSYTLTAGATDNLGAVTTSAPVTITVSPAPITITSPANGATVTGDTVLVRGTFVGPANTGITVNGVVAVTDDNNNFYAHNVRLQAGANTLTAKRTTETDETATQSITVNSDGLAPPVQISATPLSGVAPLTVSFTIKNGTASSVNVKMNGNPIFDVPAGAEGSFSLTFGSPTIFPVTVSADGQGSSTSKDFVLVAKDGARVDQMFQGIWTNIASRLAAGNVGQALVYFAPDVRDLYQSVFSDIIDALPGMFSVPPVIHPTNFSAEDDVEYFVVVQQNGTNYGYRLYFSQGADGVWRLSSL